VASPDLPDWYPLGGSGAEVLLVMTRHTHPLGRDKSRPVADRSAGRRAKIVV
jgi:hypothetical protein